jgi:hypothetical protein
MNIIETGILVHLRLPLVPEFLMINGKSQGGGGGKRFLPSPECPASLWGPPRQFCNGYLAYYMD